MVRLLDCHPIHGYSITKNFVNSLAFAIFNFPRRVHFRNIVVDADNTLQLASGLGNSGGSWIGTVPSKIGGRGYYWFG